MHQNIISIFTIITQSCPVILKPALNRSCFSLQARRNKDLHFLLKSLIGVHTKEIHLRHVHKLLVYFLKEHNNKLYRIENGHYDIDTTKEIFFEVNSLGPGIFWGWFFEGLVLKLF